MKIAEENRLLDVASKYAQHSINYDLKIKNWQNKLARLQGKYQALDNRPAHQKIVFFLLMIAHLCLAVLAGSNMMPILYNKSGTLENYGDWSSWVYPLLAVIPVLSISLLIGMLAWNIRPSFNPVVPRQVHYDKMSLLGVLLLSVLYVGVLYYIVLLGTQPPIEESASLYIYLILVYGGLELAVGLFAPRGWEFCAYWWRKNWLERKVMRYQNRRTKARFHCDRYYRYYSQVANPANLQMSVPVQQVLWEMEAEEQ